MKILRFLLPLVAYFVLEFFFGALVAVIVAVVIALVQILIQKIQKRPFETSQIVDIAVVILFGVIDILFEESSGMMWIVTPLILALLLILSLTTNIDFFGTDYITSRMKNPYSRYNFQRCQKRMIVWCFICSALSCVVFFCQDEELALTIRRYTLLTILLGYVATEIIANQLIRFKYGKAEWVPLIDEEGKIVGTSPRELVHNGSLWLHPVVHLHVFYDGKLLLQLRPMTKKIQPGKWDTAVGGHITAGEKIEDSLKREVWEEIGLKDFGARLIKRYIWRSNEEHEYVFSFRSENAGPFEPQNRSEVDDLRFFSRKEIEEKMGKNIFTPNLEYELKEWILQDKLLR